MAWLPTIAFCSIILVLQTCSVTSSFNLAPMLSPFLETGCKDVECGKGTCKASNKTFSGYACECEPGWKQSRPEHDDDLKFLPCVIPNCTLDLSCAEAPSPAPAKEKRANDSFFDTCHWADCGGGTCNKISLFTHKCECNEGYYNLLNVTAFPCFKECALGMDCSRLGIDITNKSTSPPPSLSENSKNQATSTSTTNLNWKILISFSVALVLWK